MFSLRGPTPTSLENASGFAFGHGLKNART
jgi:hypothetical protein